MVIIGLVLDRHVQVLLPGVVGFQTRSTVPPRVASTFHVLPLRVASTRCARTSPLSPPPRVARGDHRLCSPAVGTALSVMGPGVPTLAVFFMGSRVPIPGCLFMGSRVPIPGCLFMGSRVPIPGCLSFFTAVWRVFSRSGLRKAFFF